MKLLKTFTLSLAAVILYSGWSKRESGVFSFTTEIKTDISNRALPVFGLLRCKRAALLQACIKPDACKNLVVSEFKVFSPRSGREAPSMRADGGKPREGFLGVRGRKTLNSDTTKNF